ncbi:hypothetical protein ACIBJC_25715 [Streptomyces sp. NPDC050509]|uniref:hypothetical protein n=1 Tax=Streptomyces sp. NPDC050509 TaxID=3365620 RepID=UPI00379D241A
MAFTERAALTGYTESVSAMAVLEIVNRPHAVTGTDKTVRVSDLMLIGAVAVPCQPLAVNAMAVKGVHIILGMAKRDHCAPAHPLHDTTLI